MRTFSFILTNGVHGLVQARDAEDARETVLAGNGLAGSEETLDSLTLVPFVKLEGVTVALFHDDGSFHAE